MKLVLFVWVVILGCNYIIKKVQPTWGWYFYYSMAVGILYTISKIH